MSNDFKTRLKGIEQRISAKAGAGTFRILLIAGGLPGPINFAYAGARRWDRAEGEDFDNFIQRSVFAAREAGERAINIGGLLRGDELAKFKSSEGGFDFEAWWETVAPF